MITSPARPMGVHESFHFRRHCREHKKVEMFPIARGLADDR
jgi:hypothetical protein